MKKKTVLTDKQITKLSKEYIKGNGFESAQVTTLKQDIDMWFDGIEKDMSDADLTKVAKEVKRLGKLIMAL